MGIEKSEICSFDFLLNFLIKIILDLLICTIWRLRTFSGCLRTSRADGSELRAQASDFIERLRPFYEFY